MGSHDGLGRRAAIGVLVALCTEALAQVAWAGSSKGRDLVVLDHERWLDTLKGTVKNFSKRSARDVTVIVKFLDKKKKALGTQRVNVGDLRSGDQSSWSLAISEKHRAATHYAFETHAIWP
jgi:hypothetical protein